MQNLLESCGLRRCDLQASLLLVMWDLSSPTRDWTHVVCIARQILNQWTPGKSHEDSFIKNKQTTTEKNRKTVEKINYICQQENTTCKLWVVLFRELIEDWSLSVALRKCSKEVREGPGWIGVFAEKKKATYFKRSLLITKNQTSQVNDFITCNCIVRCRRLGSLKLFLR